VSICIPSVLAELASVRFVAVTGKGGVGKSTVAAALGRLWAAEGQRTLVCEVNADDRVGQLLAGRALTSRVEEVGANLWAVNVRPQEALIEYATMTLKFELVSRALFENAMVRQLLRFVPSIQELVLLGKVLFHVRDAQRRFDRVILDAPATGHAVTFFSVPQVILDTVPPGPMADDARWMRDLLADPATTGAVLVTLPEETPVNETLELDRALRQNVHMSPRAVVLNRVTPHRFEPEEVRSLPPPLRAYVEADAARAAQARASAERLAATDVPLRLVPRFFVERFDLASLDAFGRALAGAR
jgi:anion-transporting  ArsA/GET3 family ATPase